MESFLTLLFYYLNLCTVHPFILFIRSKQTHSWLTVYNTVLYLSLVCDVLALKHAGAINKEQYDKQSIKCAFVCSYTYRCFTFSKKIYLVKSRIFFLKIAATQSFVLTLLGTSWGISVTPTSYADMATVFLLSLIGKGKGHPCTGTEALYRPCGP